MTAQSMFGIERILHLPGILAQQLRGIAQLDKVVLNVKINPAGGLPLEDDGVVA
jgi:hypothetical protein